MAYGTRRLFEKENTVQDFTVQFFLSSVNIDGTLLPLGQVSTDVLNLSDEQLFSLHEKSAALMTAARGLLHPDAKKSLAHVTNVQSVMNEVLDRIFDLPLFCHLDLNREYSRRMLIDLFTEQPEFFSKIVDIDTVEAAAFLENMQRISTVFDEVISFRTFVTVMLDFYFERLKKRNSECYAIGVYEFLSDSKMLDEIRAHLPPMPSFEFRQSRGAMIEYVTMPNPADKKRYMMAERMVFYTIGAFLHVDFFRGLMQGNAPRRCQNCGRFFLLTSGYNTCYCNNIAPGEAERTCRRVGAHRKEALKAEQSLVQAEYKKVYSRLKTRKHRGKISDDEWNQAVAKAQEYKERAERGELTEFELQRLYKEV